MASQGGSRFYAAGATLARGLSIPPRSLKKSVPSRISMGSSSGSCFCSSATCRSSSGQPPVRSCPAEDPSRLRDTDHGQIDADGGGRRPRAERMSPAERRTRAPAGGVRDRGLGGGGAPAQPRSRLLPLRRRPRRSLLELLLGLPLDVLRPRRRMPERSKKRSWTSSQTDEGARQCRPGHAESADHTAPRCGRRSDRRRGTSQRPPRRGTRSSSISRHPRMLRAAWTRAGRSSSSCAARRRASTSSGVPSRAADSGLNRPILPSKLMRPSSWRRARSQTSPPQPPTPEVYADAA